MSRRRKFEDRTTKRFILFTLVGLFGAVAAWQFLGWESYVQGWVGAMFRATAGGTLGFLFSRFGLGLRLGDISPEVVRAEAAKSQALCVVGFAIAVAVGV